MNDERKKYKIAIVEDEKGLRKSLADFMESKGCEVLTAENGTQALSLIKTQLPDLVVLDVLMPGIDGFHVLDRLKKDRKTMDIPVILLTVRSSEADIERGIRHLAEEYVPKPFEPESLYRRIQRILATRKG